jgi:hypothetical protein
MGHLTDITAIIREEERMTQKTANKLKVLRAATVKYSPRIQEQLTRAGKNSDSAAVTESAAKYYVALKKLAEK